MACQGLHWNQDYGLKCFQGQHAVLMGVLGVPGLVLFSLGVPLVSAWWLRRNAHAGKLNSSRFSARFGFLYEDYTRPYYFWESIIMFRWAGRPGECSGEAGSRQAGRCVARCAREPHG